MKIPLSYEQPIISTTRYSFPPQIITVLLINQLIEVVSTNSGLYSCGIILGPLITLFIAVANVYSMFLYTKTIAFYHLATVDEVTGKVFNRPVSIIFGIITIIYGLCLCIRYYYIFSNTLIRIILFFEDDPPPTVIDPLFLNSIFFLIFVIPIIHTISLKVMFIISIISIISLLFMVITLVYNFAVELTAKSDVEVKYLVFENVAIQCFSNMVIYFQLFPFNYPGIRHLKHNSIKMWMMVIIRVYTFGFFIYVFIGILTYYDSNSVFKNTSTVTICILFGQLIQIISSITAMMNPIRYTIQNCFLRLTSVDPIMWYFFGYCLQVGSLIISSLYKTIGKYIELINVITSITLSFILPAILYLSTFKYESKIHFILSIFILCFMVLMLILYILQFFSVI